MKALTKNLEIISVISTDGKEVYCPDEDDKGRFKQYEYARIARLSYCMGTYLTTTPLGYIVKFKVTKDIF